MLDNASVKQPQLSDPGEDPPPSSHVPPGPSRGEGSKSSIAPIPFNTPQDFAQAEVSGIDKTLLEIRLHYSIRKKESPTEPHSPLWRSNPELRYPIDAVGKDDRYRIEVYLFLPSSLGVNASTYGRTDFYRDMLTYFSFGVPRAAVSEIAEGSAPGPLVRRITGQLNRYLRRPEPGRLDQLSGDLRMLGCVVGMYLEDNVRSMGEDIKLLRGSHPLPTNAVAALKARAEALIADLRAMMVQVRNLSPRLDEPSVPERMREVYRSVDDYLSMTIESEFMRLITHMSRDPEVAAATVDMRRALIDVVVAEQQVCAAAGYRRMVKPDEERSAEYLIHRSSVLKKFVRSVLFLELARGEDQRKITEAVAAIAAGTAMLISSIISLIGQQVYGINTTSFILLIVVAYMLKDRIKDWLKRFVLLKVSQFRADYSVSVKDKSSGKILGECRELFSFPDPARLPRGVLASRYAIPRNISESESEPESIMRYEKQVRLYSRRIRTLYREVSSVQDVIRLDVTELLQRADGSERQTRIYRPDLDAAETLRCMKAYHLNVVFVMSAERTQSAAIVGRVRVVLDKNGIKRIEQA